MSSVLSKYKRQPKIYINIPSELRFVDETVVEGSFKEVPVYSMSGADEIMMRNPEALLNGETIKHLVKSCIPSIKDPGRLSFIDFEYLLMSIRIATYGPEHSKSSKCPHCSEENTHTVNLSALVDNYSNKTYDTTVSVGDLKIMVEPLTYNQWSDVQQKIFVAQRTAYQAAQLPQAEKEETEKVAYNMLKDISEQSICMQAKRIVTPEGEETDQSAVTEFLLNEDRIYYNAVKTKLEENVESWELKPLELTCAECEKDYMMSFTMDDSNFFVGR